jgi:hypothetical protein
MASKMKHTKGERLNIRFNKKIKLEFHGTRLTSDGGLLAYRELDEALELFNYDAVHTNELLFNATRWTGISSPWIFKEKQRISKKMVTYWIQKCLRIALSCKTEG